MCVIAYKAKGVKFPSEKSVREMWAKNPDGAGVMWRAKGGEIRFRKGFMELKDLESFIAENRAELGGSEVAIHFRITTHGGTCPKNCHPFVIGDNPHIMSGSAKRILMHNGILPLIPRRNDISDTGEMAIRLGDFSSPRDALARFNECLKGNRILLMDEKGTHFFGDEFKRSTNKENEGILYSNLNHEFSASCGFGSWWDSKGGYGERCRFDGKAFKNVVTGKTVAIEDVDPDWLSDRDYEVWESAMGDDFEAREYARSLGITLAEFRDLEAEAESFGMSVDEYIDDIYGNCEEDAAMAS